MMITSYRDLDAWQLSMELAQAIYEVTSSFPPDERFGLISQLRRSAVGIPSHISEGHPQSTGVYRRYVLIALGCQAECETQLELARRLKMATDIQLGPVVALTERVGKVLHGLLRSLPDADRKRRA
jgi:four helix bundle protein